jgi:hypothetical protein
MNSQKSTTLLMSCRNTEDNQLVWRAAVERGWSVERVRGLQVPTVESDRVLVYIESLFAPAIAQRFSLTLIQPPDNWLVKLPKEYRLRDIALTTLGDVADCSLPLFLKPPNEKSFPAQVYDNVEQLLVDYGPSTPILTSTPVQWEVEYRCFCLDGQVRALSPYFRNGKLSKLDDFSATEQELSSAKNFAERVLRDTRVTTPNAIVIDVGTLSTGEWAVVEANSAWGSGIYGCDPTKVLDVVEQATVKCLERPDH